MEKILEPDEVLMEGAPGIDKSTLTLELCTMWEEFESIQQYNLVWGVSLQKSVRDFGSPDFRSPDFRDFTMISRFHWSREPDPLPNSEGRIGKGSGHAHTLGNWPRPF